MDRQKGTVVLKPKRARKFVVIAEERIGPTPETAAKLKPDPLALMLQRGQLEEGQIDAAIEIREVYGGVVGGNRCHTVAMDGRFHGGMSDRIAWIHAKRYLPWIRECGKHAARLVLDLAWFGQEPRTPTHVSVIAFALSDYRRRMLLTTPPRGC